MGHAQKQRDVVKIDDVEKVEEPGFLRRYLFRGEHLLCYFSQMQPGVNTMDLPEHYRKHSNEEIVYVLQGKLEYEDGRIVEAGMITINHPGMPHGCKVIGDQPVIALAFHSPPPERFDEAQMVNKFHGFHKKRDG